MNLAPDELKLYDNVYKLLDAEMAPGRVARWYEMHLLDAIARG